MDGLKSRKSDIAATRKRRSSILKSQRPPRTPFSELEFNVATPPDAAKSRRVSFSRRNGVAEFEITEATTAWKNVYEEHNKSMESSVNESDGNEKKSGRRVGHLGSRLTDFQFQDTEAEIINTGSRDQLITSFSAPTLVTTSDDKSTSASNSRVLEFTEFTEQETNQLFDNDANPIIMETTDHIDVDFSAVATIGDNLEVIDNVDQERKGNMSYVDVDLNATHFSIKGEESMSDMSITDTIHSPKVAASKSTSEEKKSNVTDWVEDKENIVVNPYAAPQPAENFAVSDDVDDVLVFDGKKCKFQSNLSSKSSSDPSASDVNHADQKPNVSQKWKTIVYDDDEDISITQAIPSGVILPMLSAESRELADIVYDDDFHISMTQAVPSNVILSSQPEMSSDKQKTVFFDDLGDMTVTQAVPSNILCPRLDESRKTIVHEHDNGNISMTEGISTKIISETEARDQNYLRNDVDEDISMTQAVPNVLEPKVDERRKTIVYENDEGDISVTEAIMAKIISETETCGITIVYKDEDGDISMTQAIPNLFGPKVEERRKSTEDKNDDGHVSMTKAMSEAEMRRMTILYKNEEGDISMTQAVPVDTLRIQSPERERRKTIVYDNNAADISITQSVPNNVILQEIKNKLESLKESVTNTSTRQALPATEATNKRRTILFSSDQGNVSITQALPANLIVAAPSLTDDGNTIVKGASENVSETKTSSVDLADPNKNKSKLNEDEHNTSNVDRDNVKMTPKRRSNLYNVSNTQPDTSITDDIPLKSMSSKNTSIKDMKLYNTSITKPIPTHMISIENELENDLKKYKVNSQNDGNYSAGFNKSVTDRGVLVFDAAIKLDLLQKKDSTEETVSVNGKTSSTSKLSREDPETMEEEDEKSSAESMIEVRSGSSRDYVGDKTRDMVNKSLLNDLLDMTTAYGAPGDAEGDDNNLIIKSNSDGSSDNAAVTTNLKEPTESYFIIKDSDEEQVDQAQSKKESFSLAMNKIPLSESSKKSNHGVVGTIRHKLGELRDYINSKSSPESKRLPLKSPARKDVKREEVNRATGAKMPVNNCNDTNAILDMLSEFTDDPVEKDLKTEDTLASPLKIKGLLAIEHKTEANEPTRRSLVPSRMAMVRSREDLLEDISMAKAMIKYASEETDDTANDSHGETYREPFSLAQGASCGNEVVKHLKFDEDDSFRDASTQQPILYTPLKKTAFGETAYMKDEDYDKAKVIPGFLSNLSEDLKQIMNDLTKPMVNDNPFNKTQVLSPNAQKVASTCSTQVQANLVTSSQIDLGPDQLSCSPARSQHEAPWSANKPARELPSNLEHIDSPENETPGFVVFDHCNPLNNVLLPPIDAAATHKYNPCASNENMTSFVLPNSAHDVEPGVNRDTDSRVVLYSPAPPLCATLCDANSNESELSRPVSMDQAVGAIQDVKETEANTVIAMKANKELLEASSSLTLVDNAPTTHFLDSSPDDSPSHKKSAKSAVQVIYHIKEQESDVTSNDEDGAEVQLKAKKRIYSPQKRDKKHFGAEEEFTLSPKPASKVQKVSSSVKPFKNVDWMAPSGSAPTKPADYTLSVSRTSPAKPDATTDNDMVVLDISTESSEDTKPDQKSGTMATIQQLLAQYESSIDHKKLTSQILAALSDKTNFTSELLSESAPKAGGKYLAGESVVSGSRQDLHSDSEGMASQVSRSDCQSRPDWQPELIHEMSSKNLVIECESGVNVVAKIDVLPFMGSSECEWESRGADAWSFRLLRARVRLVVRLEHRHENALRTCVRADTVVRSVALDQLPQTSKENPIAVLCVKFAAETMRHVARRGCARAGDVPALLRRCAGVARVALRWGRAMHAARAQLAFTLAEDGALSLKVANIPLRSVWEVTMRVELVAGDLRDTPWPRADAVRVVRVVSECAVHPHELRRVLHAVPADWGHVPRAVWKIFKYLKNRTVDDDLLTGL